MRSYASAATCLVYSAYLRAVHNQFGFSGIYRLPPATLDQAVRTVRLDRLTAMCAGRTVGTGEPIVLDAAKPYWWLPEDMTVTSFNLAFSPTRAPIAAMEAGSAFGGHMPAAGPANCDDDGRPLAPGERREGGGEGVRSA